MSDPIGHPNQAHTRAQALADGTLSDISDFSKEAYFRCPMAVSDDLFYNYLSPPYNLLSQGQSLTSRIQDTLTELKTAIYAHPKALKVIFTASFLMLPDDEPTPISIQITATLGRGDDGKPVITLSLLEDNRQH
ncbi:hypothetical protein FACS1894137_07200 [Spirochaetia bacterium]|nr:hypothetical protein FACS1894137_07200 [Spirochaetia bacterium]